MVRLRDTVANTLADCGYIAAAAPPRSRQSYERRLLLPGDGWMVDKWIVKGGCGYKAFIVVKQNEKRVVELINTQHGH